MRLNLGTITEVAQTIQTQEGWYPGSLAYQNNNPGNLVPAGQPGCSIGAGGFCQFASYDAGYQALQNQILLDANRGFTILQFTTKYLGGNPNNPGIAPGGNPVTYAQAIASATGTTPDSLLIDAINNGGSIFGNTGVMTAGFDLSGIDPMWLLAGGAVILVLLLR